MPFKRVYNLVLVIRIKWSAILLQPLFIYLFIYLFYYK